MIHSIEIENFRCFRSFEILKCNSVNIIVGDNGVGKTALLEGIFLALASTPSVALRLRQQRGLEGQFQGATTAIERAFWGGFFHRGDLSKPIQIRLKGDGDESRSVRILQGFGETSTLALDSDLGSLPSRAVTFEWTDAKGEVFAYTPQLSSDGAKMPDSRETLPDFFMFSATSHGSARENAERFSELSKVGRQSGFIEALRQEYNWIEDISIETLGGYPVLHAKLKGHERKIPLNDVSAGITRLVSILLAISSNSGSVVIVDEIENGVYFEHMRSSIGALIAAAKRSKCQLFLTTHSMEWLRAYAASMSNGHDIGTSVWRLSRGSKQPDFQQFSGHDLVDGIEFGEEVR